MHWVLQSTIQSVDVTIELIKQIQRQGATYEIVKVIPFAGVCVPDANPSSPSVFAMGGFSMELLAQKKGWTPGYLWQNLSYRHLLKNYGHLMMNYDCVVTSLRDAIRVWPRFHVRPNEERKSFSGEVMDWAKFEEFRRGVLTLKPEEVVLLGPDTLIIMSPLREIWLESRLIVVRGQVVCGSEYRVGQETRYRRLTKSEPAWSFAQSAADKWCPNDAFCLDVAYTGRGWQVLETNAVNSCGLYACDVSAFVGAINSLGDPT